MGFIDWHENKPSSHTLLQQQENGMFLKTTPAGQSGACCAWHDLRNWIKSHWAQIWEDKNARQIKTQSVQLPAKRVFTLTFQRSTTI